MCLPCPATLPARGVTHSSLCEAKKATRPNHQIIAPNDGAPSTKKRGKGQVLPICARKGFPKPPVFPPKPPEDLLTLPDNPTHPAAFSARVRPASAPLPALFAAKRGFFAPTPAVPAPPKGARTPRFAPAPPGFCPARPRKKARLGPVLPGIPAPRTPPAPRKRPRVRLFAPIAPVFFPPCTAFRPPSPLPPPEGQPAPPRHFPGAGKPDSPGQLFRFAVEKCAPKGGIKSLKSGGWRPRPPLA